MTQALLHLHPAAPFLHYGNEQLDVLCQLVAKIFATAAPRVGTKANLAVKPIQPTPPRVLLPKKLIANTLLTNMLETNEPNRHMLLPLSLSVVNPDSGKELEYCDLLKHPK